MRTFRELYEQQQMRIVMLGGPGSGKSTYTEYLIRHFQINHIFKKTRFLIFMFYTRFMFV